MTQNTAPRANRTSRIGVLGVFVHESGSIARVNHVLQEFASLIRGRMGLPNIPADPPLNVIALIFSGSSDQLGALSGRLGQIPGVETKSVLSREAVAAEVEKQHAQ